MHKGKVLRNTYGAESKHWSVSEQANPHEDVQEYYQTHFNILSCETIRKSRIKGVQKSSAFGISDSMQFKQICHKCSILYSHAITTVKILKNIKNENELPLANNNIIQGKYVAKD